MRRPSGPFLPVEMAAYRHSAALKAAVAGDGLGLFAQSNDWRGRVRWKVANVSVVVVKRPKSASSARFMTRNSEKQLRMRSESWRAIASWFKLASAN